MLYIYNYINNIFACLYRCGYEFCYTCGAPWKDKKATCSCKLWDEDYILDSDEDGDEFDDDEFDDDDYESDSDDYYGIL